MMRDFLIGLLSIILAPSMATRRQRRTLGAVVLILVVVLVVLGSLYLNAGVSPGTSLVWWGGCFLLMLWSVYLAYLDVKSIKRDLRTQKKELFLSIFSQPGPKTKGREKSQAQPRPGKLNRQERKATEGDLNDVR
jgi:O-antigen/teichoic acid export membrane protein